MRRAILLLVVLPLLNGCVAGRCRVIGALFEVTCIEPPIVQADPTMELPPFNARDLIDTKVDGFTLQAIRIAADNFLPLTHDPKRPCSDTQPAHTYKAFRKDDVIFVRIDYRPENCGETTRPFDGGATYAISVDGRILAREVDGRGRYP